MDTTLDQQVRAFVYDQTMKSGSVPSVQQITFGLGKSREEISAVLKQLADTHMLVLQGETGEILMANPFSAVPTQFLVRAGGVNYFGNCIWDAFGIPSMLKQDAVIQASCSDCGTAMILKVANGQLEPTQGVAHFAVPASHWWDDVVFT